MLNFRSRLAPGATEHRIAAMTEKMHLHRDKPAPSTAGNIFEPIPEWTSIRGGWRVKDRITLRRAALAGVAVLAPVLLAAWFRPGVKAAFSGEKNRSTTLFNRLKPTGWEPGRAIVGRFPF